MKIIIPGDPIPKMRARYSTRSGYVLTYDPQNAKKMEIVFYLKRHIDNLTMADIPELTEITQGESFSINLTFHIPLNKNDSQAQRNAKLWHIQPCNKKPDIDNLSKFYLDCANNILYKDDCQISSLKAIKIYSEIPKTIIEIMANKKIKYDTKTQIVLTQFSPEMVKEFISETQNFRDMLFCDFSTLNRINSAPSIEDFSERICLFAQKYADVLKKIKKNME